MAQLLTGKRTHFIRSPIVASVHAPTLLELGVCSDPGPARSCNEDRWQADPAQGLFMLADGMGGAGAGEVASETVLSGFSGDARAGLDAGMTPAESLVRAGVQAHARVLAAARAQPECLGMGSTLVAAMLTERTLTVAHVGDSRAYVMRDGVLTRLTEDHSVMQELVQAGRISAARGRRNVSKGPLTRVLGVTDLAPVVQVCEADWQCNDLLLLCTDGLSDALDGDELGCALTRLLNATHHDLNLTAQGLVTAALSAGCRDNVTVLITTALHPAR
jgi:protein phosphatase